MFGGRLSDGDDDGRGRMHRNVYVPLLRVGDPPYRLLLFIRFIVVRFFLHQISFSTHSMESIMNGVRSALLTNRWALLIRETKHMENVNVSACGMLSMK